MAASEDRTSGANPLSRGGPRAGETFVEWPHCPSCGAPRPARCPACDTVGVDWERAFSAPAAEIAPPEDLSAGGTRYAAAVICPTCDEVFRPAFARQCARCGGDLSGHEPTAARIGDAPVDEAWDEAANRRTRLTTGQMLRLILALLAAAGVIYTLYDWLMSNTGGARLF